MAVTLRMLQLWDKYSMGTIQEALADIDKDLFVDRQPSSRRKQAASAKRRLTKAERRSLPSSDESQLIDSGSGSDGESVDEQTSSPPSAADGDSLEWRTITSAEPSDASSIMSSTKYDFIPSKQTGNNSTYSLVSKRPLSPVASLKVASPGTSQTRSDSSLRSSSASYRRRSSDSLKSGFVTTEDPSSSMPEILPSGSDELTSVVSERVDASCTDSDTDMFSESTSEVVITKSFTRSPGTTQLRRASTKDAHVRALYMVSEETTPKAVARKSVDSPQPLSSSEYDSHVGLRRPSPLLKTFQDESLQLRSPSAKRLHDGGDSREQISASKRNRTSKGSVVKSPKTRLVRYSVAETTQPSPSSLGLSSPDVSRTYGLRGSTKAGTESNKNESNSTGAVEAAEARSSGSEGDASVDIPVQSPIRRLVRYSETSVGSPSSSSAIEIKTLRNRRVSARQSVASKKLLADSVDEFQLSPAAADAPAAEEMSDGPAAEEDWQASVSGEEEKTTANSHTGHGEGDTPQRPRRKRKSSKTSVSNSCSLVEGLRPRLKNKKRTGKSRYSVVDPELSTMSATPKHYAETTRSAKTPKPSRRKFVALDGQKFYETPKLVKPDTEAPIGLRRSKRTRLPKLRGYAGERPVYKLDRATNTRYIAGIEKQDPREDSLLMFFVQQRTGENKQKQVKKRTKKAVAVDSDVSLSDGEVPVYNEQLDDVVKEVVTCTKEECYFNLDGTVADEDASVKICKIMHDETTLALVGKLHLGAFASKPLSRTNAHSVIFSVLQGTVTVTYNEQHKKFLKAGHTFRVPCGNSYALKNVSSDECILQYTTIQKT